MDTHPQGINPPLLFSQELPYLTMQSHSEQEWDTSTHVILTSDTYWDPSALDIIKAEEDEQFDNNLEPSKLESRGTFDMHRFYDDRTIVQDNKVQYAYSKTYAKYYDLKTDICFHHATTPQDKEKNFSHLDLFKYQNTTLNLKNMTTIQSILYLVGYILTSLNGHF